MIELTKENFDEVVLKSAIPVVVDFWAPWCGPCKAAVPALEALSVEMTRVSFGKSNTDEQPELADRFQIRGIPTFVLFVDGAEVARTVGFPGKLELRDFIEQK